MVHGRYLSFDEETISTALITSLRSQDCIKQVPVVMVLVPGRTAADEQIALLERVPAMEAFTRLYVRVFIATTNSFRHSTSKRATNIVHWFYLARSTEQ